MLDYLSLKESHDEARRHIIAIKDIDKEGRKGLSNKETSKVIQAAKQNYL